MLTARWIENDGTWMLSVVGNCTIMLPTGNIWCHKSVNVFHHYFCHCIHVVFVLWPFDPYGQKPNIFPTIFESVWLSIWKRKISHLIKQPYYTVSNFPKLQLATSHQIHILCLETWFIKCLQKIYIEAENNCFSTETHCLGLFISCYSVFISSTRWE